MRFPPVMKVVARRYVIRKQKQLAALASAARQEIADVLAEAGPLSVAEIALILGRPADALYFHVRALKLARLVRQVGYRYRGMRKEALFRTISPELRLEYAPCSEPNRRAVTPLSVPCAGRQRELWGLRRVSRLTLPQLAAVNRSIERMRQATAKSRGRGRRYAVTVLLAPLDHRSRGAHGNRKREQAGKK
jgi:hypothetical protein